MKPRKTGILRRSFDITRIGAEYFLFSGFNRHKSDPLGLRLRLACERLGLVFIKLGQVLATRYDLLDKEDCRELAKLLDDVPGFPEEELRAIFTRDFGLQPEEIFSEFEIQPIASASISQVHVGRLKSGEKVAVKVRRPDAPHFIASDMHILRALLRQGKYFFRRLRHVNTDRIINELESFLLAEVDFKNEIANIKIVEDFYHGEGMRQIAEEYVSKIHFPKVHENFSSSNVIVMEFVEGVPVKNAHLIRNNPDYDIETSLVNMMGAVMRAWMTGKGMYFHADPHPSNILIQPHGRVALLDFGLMGHFEKRDRETTRDLFLAIYSKNLERVIELGLKLANLPVFPYGDIIRNDIASYIETAHSSGMGFWFTGFIRIFLKHGLPLPYQLILYARMHVIMDGLFETALPGRTTLDILGQELRWGLRRRTLENIKEADLGPLLYALSEKIKNSPNQVAAAVSKYFDDPLQAVRDFREALR